MGRRNSSNLGMMVGVMGICVVAMLMIGAFFYTPVKVPAGHVGVKVYLLGGAKGVDHEEVGVGRYFLTINQDMFLFPTYTQNYVWTKDPAEGSKNDESISFQDVDGLSIGADVGISYHIDPTKVAHVFQKYRKGVDEITDIFLRNMVRDAFVSHASKLKVDKIYGTGKADLLGNVTVTVSEAVKDIGIVIEKIYLVGDMRLPGPVLKALNAKIEATQRAQQRENEVAEATAQAMKDVAIAEGKKKQRVLQAEGKAESITLEAEAQAKANRILAASLTGEFVEYKKVIQWDGVLPKMTGDVIPMINSSAMVK